MESEIEREKWREIERERDRMRRLISCPVDPH